MKLDYKKIITLMARLNMSRPEFLDRAGISDFTIRSIAKGKNCRSQTAQCIADALGCTIEDILAEEEEEPLPAPEPAPAPDAITQTLEAVKEYGEHEYQRGRSEMCDLFLKAVREAIERWKENNEEGEG